MAKNGQKVMSLHQHPDLKECFELLQQKGHQRDHEKLWELLVLFYESSQVSKYLYYYNNASKYGPMCQQ